MRVAEHLGVRSPLISQWVVTIFGAVAGTNSLLQVLMVWLASLKLQWLGPVQ